jgi:nitrogen fixation/metabolism regulation signal transduction histidine kinase
MNSFTRRTKFLLAGNILGLIISVILLTYVFFSKGLSATLVLVSIIVVSLIAYLFSLFNQRDKQVMQVIKALANGDNSLGFGVEHPMTSYLEDAKKQMQQARFTAEQQSDFFKTLLIHINLAVIVCDAQGNIVEVNPAVHRLLGKNVNHLVDLNEVGTIILAAEKPFNSTVPWQHGEHQDTLTLQVSLAEIQGEMRKIITLQSIHELLLNKEQQAYKRLTRVLTHEVANTITPLASLAEICETLIPESQNFIDDESKEDLQLALSTLATRTRYLGKFIEHFKEVSSLPAPVLKPTTLAPIVERLALLHKQQFLAHDILFEFNLTEQQLVMLDSIQIEQVLINLINNAIDALTLKASEKAQVEGGDNEQARITVTINKNNAQQLYLEVADNGLGLNDKLRDMVFVPFFTTKQQGTGIGLSLSRQIMANHGGDLVYIKREKGACFRCVFG